jgi:quinol-cytochrome oxidoreductase complex cytochrome b subunit
MFILLKIINVLRLALNVLTFLLFMDYFEMQGSPTADETVFFAGLLILVVPTIILWALDFVIYSRGPKPRRNQYLSIIANLHYIYFIVLSILSTIFVSASNVQSQNSVDSSSYGFWLMTIMFCLLLVASLTNIYQLFFIKKASINKTAMQTN